MRIELVVFDLDGTLISSGETIYKATVQSLNRLNIQGELPFEEFNKRIGWHFEDIFDELGISLPDFEEFITIYKSVYFDFIESSKIYPGVIEIIKYLKENGIKISLLTTKAQDQADKILDYFNLSPDFAYIMGRRPGIAHKPSPEPLLKICSDLSTGPANCMMVGDSEMDIQCGKNAGTKTCAVTYGYRATEILIDNSPDYILDSITELRSVISENGSLLAANG